MNVHTLVQNTENRQKHVLDKNRGKSGLSIIVHTKLKTCQVKQSFALQIAISHIDKSLAFVNGPHMLQFKAFSDHLKFKGTS